MELKRADNPRAAYVAVNPDEALPSGDPRYVDLGRFRGEVDVIKKLLETPIAWTDAEREANGEPRQFLKLLLTGHRGCGKSTELLRLQSRLEEQGYFVVYLAAELEMNLNDMDWSDILITMVHQIAQAVQTSPLKLTLPDAPLERITDWLAQVMVKKEERQDQMASLETEFAVEAGLPFFAKVLAAVKAMLKTSSSHVKEVRREVERKASVLLTDLNEFLDRLQVQLRDRGRKGLVVIVDGLEKITLYPLTERSPITTHNAIYIQHGEHLKSPRCHIVYTMPIALLTEANIGQIFPSRIAVLPMVKVRRQNGEPDPEAVQAMCEMVHRRVDVEKVFASDAVLEELCLASGGHVRDFLRLVHYACLGTEGQVDHQAAEDAIYALMNEYDGLVKDVDLEKLVAVHRMQRLPSDPAYARLPSYLLTLEYRNQDKWVDVHPLVARLPKFQEADRHASEAIILSSADV
jgi:hypothetical protein